jgi:hypothetical protein
VQRVAERGGVLAGLDRRKHDGDDLARRLLEPERGRSHAFHEPETVEHLRREREVRRVALASGVVVARHERPDELQHPRRRHAGDRHQPRAEQIVPLGPLVDDVNAVCEVVEPKRVEVEGASVVRERDDAGVAVARAWKRSNAHEADEELVVAQRAGPSREALDLGVEPLSRHVAEETRVGLLERPPEQADVAGGVGSRGGRGPNDAGGGDDGEPEREQEQRRARPHSAP